ncbi:MAG: imidazole glycerol phosphate synthase subunit HisH, partial [Planctomycetia bacterium]
VVSSDPDVVRKAERLVLPGVGAFRDAAEQLRHKNLVEPIRSHVDAGKPFLGICLGLQLLFDVSYEDGEYAGLGLLRGKVVRFDAPPPLKVPHMGWNQLTFGRPSPLFAGLPDRSEAYFVHSYFVVPEDESVIAATTDYAGEFTAAVWRERLFATQFHPEKSQTVGLKMLTNFLGC